MEQPQAEEKVPDIFVRLARKLSATDKEVRDAAVGHVRGFLRQQKELNALEMLKLWKGLYYCMWMSDKAPVQEELASTLAAMAHLGGWRQGISYLAGFWNTICREWRGIDRLRLDKFYNLIRCMMQEGFRLLQNHSWSKEVVDTYLDMMKQYALDSSVRQVASVVMQVVDYWLTDLQSVGCESKKVATHLMGPMIRLLHECEQKSVVSRVTQRVIDALATANPLGINVKSIGKVCFELGALETTLQRNRKALYHAHQVLCEEKRVEEEEEGSEPPQQRVETGEQKEEKVQESSRSTVAQKMAALSAKLKPKKRARIVSQLSEDSLVIPKNKRPVQPVPVDVIPLNNASSRSAPTPESGSKKSKRVKFDLESNQVVRFDRTMSASSIRRETL